MAHAPGALSTYLHGMDWFRKESGFTPAEQEVVLLVISRINDCHYCVAAHSMIAEKVSKVRRRRSRRSVRARRLMTRSCAPG